MALNKYAVSLPGFSFVTYTDADGNESLTPNKDGTPRLRRTAEIEASSVGEAEHLFKKLTGVKATDREFSVKLISVGDSSE